MIREVGNISEVAKIGERFSAVQSSLVLVWFCVVCKFYFSFPIMEKLDRPS